MSTDYSITIGSLIHTIIDVCTQTKQSIYMYELNQTQT